MNAIKEIKETRALAWFIGCIGVLFFSVFTPTFSVGTAPCWYTTWNWWGWLIIALCDVGVILFCILWYTTAKRALRRATMPSN